MHEMLGTIRPGCWMLMLWGENICGEVLPRGETLLSLEGAWYLQVWRTNRLEVVTMLIYGVVWSLLEVDNLMPNPGEVSYMLLWKSIMLGVETLLIYGEFKSLAEVGTLMLGV